MVWIFFFLICSCNNLYVFFINHCPRDSFHFFVEQKSELKIEKVMIVHAIINENMITNVGVMIFY